MRSGSGSNTFGLPQYDLSSTFFTLKIHYGGVMMLLNGRYSYWGGSSSYLDYCDLDKMSIPELDGICRDNVGLLSPPKYYFKVHGQDNLAYVDTDKEMLDCICKVLERCRVVEVFCDHPVQPVIQTQASVAGSKGDDRGNELGGNEDESETEDDVDDEQEGLTDANRVCDNDYEQSDEEIPGEQEDEAHLDGLCNKKGKQPVFSDDENDVSDSGSEIDDEIRKRVVGYSETEDEEQVEDGVSKRQGVKKILPELPVFRESVDLKDPKFRVGLTFTSGSSFKNAIREYSIIHGKDIYFKKNDPTQVRALCKGAGCPFVCYASKDPKTNDFIVKTYVGEHRCTRQTRNRFATSKWLCSHYMDEFKNNDKWDRSKFIQKVQKEHILEVTASKAYRTRKLATETIEGSFEEQFAALYDYAEEIKFSNPGSTVEVLADHDQNGVLIFKRVYICYAGCKKGFIETCRPLISLDGCHIKGAHPGQLLSALGVDANNSMFPTAFAIVEKENKQSWSWFLQYLRVDLKIENPMQWTFISDKQKGLVEALAGLWEGEVQAEHRHCARHLQKNFSQKFKGQSLAEKMMFAARATTIPAFEAIMSRIKEEDVEAYQWLMKSGPRHWSKAFFRITPQCDILLNNLCESFNGTSAIRMARERPILSCLERIRMFILRRFTSQRLAISKWHGQIGPRVAKILALNMKDASEMTIDWTGQRNFQIQDGISNLFKVDLSTKTCSCRKWDLSGIPCSHAISAIWHMHEDPVNYTAHWYKRETYEKTYENEIAPIRGQDQWPNSGMPQLKKPPYHKQPGRPRKMRRLEPDEVCSRNGTKLKRFYQVLNCSKCGNPGHNARTCDSRKASVKQPTTSNKSTCAPVKKKTSTPVAAPTPVEARATARESLRATAPTSTEARATLTEARATVPTSTEARATVSTSIGSSRTFTRFKTTARKKVNITAAKKPFKRPSESR